MSIQEIISELRLRRVFIDVLLLVAGVVWLMSYTVFCYGYFGLHYINIDSLITQTLSAFIFIHMVYKGRKMCSHLEYVRDPHYSFKEDVYKKLIRLNISAICVSLTTIYFIYTQRDIIVSLF